MPDSQVLMASIFHSLEGQVCVVASNGTILAANRRWDLEVRAGAAAATAPSSVIGTPDSVGPPGSAGTDFFAFCVAQAPILGPVAQDVARAVRDVLDGVTGDAVVKRRVTTGADPRWLLTRIHLVRDTRVPVALVSVLDITEGMRTQEELRRITDEVSRLALVARHTDNAVVITDRHGVVEWVNEAFTTITGHPAAQVVGRRRRDLVRGPFTKDPRFEGTFDALESGRAVDVEFPSRTASGRPYWVHLEAAPVVEDGVTTRMVCVERDVTAHRTAQEQLKQSARRSQTLAGELAQERALLADVLATLPQQVYWKDGDLRFVGANRSYLELRGQPSEAHVVGRLESECCPPDAFTDTVGQIERQVLATGEAVLDATVVLADPEGRARTLMVSVLPHRRARVASPASANVDGVIGVSADVTHISELERQLAQSSRLESIGQLAAGIAHEINTPVQFISDNTRFVSSALAEVFATLDATAAAASGVDVAFLASEVPAALADSLEGLDRVRDIVKALKDFSHPGADLRDADLNRAVESTVQVSRNEWRYVAEVSVSLDPEVGMVRCHEGELKQALLNVVVNAAHAVAEHRERTGRTDLGRITVTTRRAGDTVVISVADDGHGIDEATRSRIFDPFFTTKKVGKGTGQGLSMTHAIVVRKHGGTLDVVSAPGEGATFVMTLPAPPS